MDAFAWIDAHLDVEERSESSFLYDGMPSQSARCLPIIYEPFDGTQRAHWAEQNSLEVFPVFAAAVIIAHLTGGAEQASINLLAGLFIAARIIHGIAYLEDRGPIRSFAWLSGMLCVIGLFVAAA